MAGQVLFYGSTNDIKQFITSIEEHNKFEYHLTGLLDKNQILKFSSLMEAKGIGIAKAGNNLFCDKFLISNPGTEIIIRDVPQSKGGVKYAIDQLKNPDTINFLPAGIFNEKNAIIEGSIATASNSEISKHIYNLFSKHLKRGFKRNGIVYIGTEAREMLNSGWRLTQNVNSPNVYDVK